MKIILDLQGGLMSATTRTILSYIVWFVSIALIIWGITVSGSRFNYEPKLWGAIPIFIGLFGHLIAFEISPQ